MWRLGDDELSLILSYIDDRHHRKSFSEVCKQWLRVEGITRTAVCLLRPNFPPSLLRRFPNLRHFHCLAPLSDNHLELLSQTCPNLKTLDLSFVWPCSHSLFHGGFCDRSLRALASCCHTLSKVSLFQRATVGDAGVASLCVFAKHHLRHLDLGGCNLVTDDALEAIGLLGSLQVLNLLGCTLVTDRGLECLASGPLCGSLKMLVLSECIRITDRGLCLLKGLSCLEDLHLAECGAGVTDVGCVAVIAAVPSLMRVNLSWLVNVSDATVIALAEHGRSLVEVRLTGCKNVSGAGVRALRAMGVLVGMEKL